RQQNWQNSLHHTWLALKGAESWKLLLTVLLMFVNWGLEGRKWQVIIKRIQRLSFIQSCKAVFTGTTLAFFTPNRIGEYMGRILYLDEGKRVNAISLTIVCSMAQLLVTWVAGIGGILYIKAYAGNNLLHTFVAQSGIWVNILLYITVASAVILTLFYFRLAGLVRWVEKMPRLQKPVAYIRVLDSLNATILYRMLS